MKTWIGILLLLPIVVSCLPPAMAQMPPEYSPYGGASNQYPGQTPGYWQSPTGGRPQASPPGTSSMSGAQFTGAPNQPPMNGPQFTGAQNQPPMNGGQFAGAQNQPPMNGPQFAGAQNQPPMNGPQFSGAQNQPPMNGPQFAGAQNQPPMNGGQFTGAQNQPMNGPQFAGALNQPPMNGPQFTGAPNQPPMNGPQFVGAPNQTLMNVPQFAGAPNQAPMNGPQFAGVPNQPNCTPYGALNGAPYPPNISSREAQFNQAVGGVFNAAADMANATAGMVNAAAGMVNAAAAKYKDMNQPGVANASLAGGAGASTPPAMLVPLFTPLNGNTTQQPAAGNPPFGLDSLMPKKKYLARHTGGTEDDRMWPINHLNLKVYIKPGDGIPRYKSSFLQVVQQACHEWEAVNNGLVAFTFVDAPEGSDIQIEWIEYCRQIGHDTSDGVTLLYYDAAGYISSAHIYLATTMPDRFLQGKQDNHTMRACTLHELGHALGLAHSPDGNDIMYFKNHSRQRIMVEGILPVNIAIQRGLSNTDICRLIKLYTTNE